MLFRSHSESKQGKDASKLCGLDSETGVLATNDVDALLALNADVVVYTVKAETRPHEVIPELERILASGANVASTSMIYLIYPPFSKAMGEPLEKACAQGKATFVVCGIDPGFSGEVVPLAVRQVSDQVEEIRVQERCD